MCYLQKIFYNLNLFYWNSTFSSVFLAQKENGRGLLLDKLSTFNKKGYINQKRETVRVSFSLYDILCLILLIETLLLWDFDPGKTFNDLHMRKVTWLNAYSRGIVYVFRCNGVAYSSNLRCITEQKHSQARLRQAGWTWCCSCRRDQRHWAWLLLHVPFGTWGDPVNLSGTIF